MHDLGFKFNSNERPGLSGNRFFEVPELAVISQTLLAFAGIYFWEALRMTCECVIALVTCVATIITTVIAVLSYLHDRKE